MNTISSKVDQVAGHVKNVLVPLFNEVEGVVDTVGDTIIGEIDKIRGAIKNEIDGLFGNLCGSGTILYQSRTAIQATKDNKVADIPILDTMTFSMDVKVNSIPNGWASVCMLLIHCLTLAPCLVFCLILKISSLRS